MKGERCLIPLSITEIRNYFTEHYPDSDVVCNYCNCSDDLLKSDKDIRDMFLDDCRDHLWYEELHYCGCGDKEAAMAAIRDYLIACWQWQSEDKNTLNKYFDCNYVWEDRLLLCLAYALDAVEFTEHGSSINRAWITDKGEVFLSTLLLSNLNNES